MRKVVRMQSAVGVRVPTEDLHVKGRVRVESLPKTGTATSVYTKPDGTLSTGVAIRRLMPMHTA